MAAMAALPGVKEYLETRPHLIGVGTDPMLVIDGTPTKPGFS